MKEVDASNVVCAEEYGRRCQSIGLERRTAPNLQHAMNHSAFEAEHHALLVRLAKQYRLSLPLRERPACYSIRLNNYETKDEMILAVEGNGNVVSKYARGLIMHEGFQLYSGPEVFEFVLGTVMEVSGKNSVRTPELYKAMLGHGFILAPHPSACYIRQEYTDQPLNERRSVLSEPVPDANGKLAVLSVVRDSKELSVYRCYAEADRLWSGDEDLWLCRESRLAG